MPSYKKLTNLSENSTHALSERYRYFPSVIGAQLHRSLNLVPRHRHVYDLHIEILDAVEQQARSRVKTFGRPLINEP
ncbi:hypothetical protein [Pseudomonas sp. Q11]|uniref:hypothetical protein n=1 Tax=Pseudomonas sp. Q11 TaxID=2968470 RepID=UPI00210BBF6A|nr:hypothetical protein [Pseudomonas sp. Q11]MCQ6257067.1 hypothetical protein [Pseudomonas sp. Q11]